MCCDGVPVVGARGTVAFRELQLRAVVMLIPRPQNLWPLAAVVAIAVMHWRRERVRTRRVAGLHLWSDAAIATATPARSRHHAYVPVLNLVAALLLALLGSSMFAGAEPVSGIVPGTMWLVRCVLCIGAAVAIAISWKLSP